MNEIFVPTRGYEVWYFLAIYSITKQDQIYRSNFTATHQSSNQAKTMKYYGFHYNLICTFDKKTITVSRKTTRLVIISPFQIFFQVSQKLIIF